MVFKKGNKRKRSKKTAVTSLKVPRRDDGPTMDIDENQPSTNSNVKLLSAARGSLESRSFSGLDYNSMANLFKSNDITSVANILYESSSPIDFDFDLPAHQSIHKDSAAASTKEKLTAELIEPSLISSKALETECAAKDPDDSTAASTKENLTAQLIEPSLISSKALETESAAKDPDDSTAASTKENLTAQLIEPSLISSKALETECAAKDPDDSTAASTKEKLTADLIEPSLVSSKALETKCTAKDPDDMLNYVSSASNIMKETATINQRSCDMPLLSSPEAKICEENRAIITRLSPTSGLLRDYRKDDICVDFDENSTIDTENIFRDNSDSTIASIEETIADINNNDNLNLQHSNVSECNNNCIDIKTTRQLSPTTGLWTDPPEKELAAQPSLSFEVEILNNEMVSNNRGESLLAPISLSQISSGIKISLPLNCTEVFQADEIAINSDLNTNLPEQDKDLTDCENSPENSIQRFDSTSTSKVLSPTTGLWRDFSREDSESDNDNAGLLLASAGPSTSQSRETPTSPSIMAEIVDNESSTSSCDDSVADPDYEEEIDVCNSNTNSGSEEILDIQQQQEISTETVKTSSESEDSRVNARKKRAKPSKWKRNVTKRLRNSGKGYTSLKTGNRVEKRRMGPTCNEFCRTKCYMKMTEEIRRGFFKRYWELKDIDQQRQFISNCMVEIQPKGRHSNVKRKLNHAFYFKIGTEKIKVCKKFFMSTLGITSRCIRTVIEKSHDGFVEQDKRGKHKKHGEIPEEIKNLARSHISSIPVVESHYRRADSTRNYIEGGRNLTDIYKDYKTDCIEKNMLYVGFSTYRNIFYFEFNLGFFKPKKDMCQFCESYKNMNEQEKADKATDYENHQNEKILSRTWKENDKEKISSKFKVACFDLEAALPTPRGEISTFYYRSKLSTYNFTICDLKTTGLGTVHCYVWHEGEGNKGSNEIGSALLHYLEHCSLPQESAELAESSGNSEMVEVTFFSDNCGGQGKNKFIISAYLYAVANFEIKSIEHKFLVVGHTQNEGDVAHSLIERNIKKALKAGPIYLPSQYSTIISTAKKSGEPFKVNEIDHDFFYDIKSLAQSTTTNFNVNEDGEKFNFNDICCIKVEKSSPGVYYYKTSFRDTEYKSVNVTRSRTRKTLSGFKNVQLTKAYADSLPISRKKYEDLQYLVNSRTIPPCHATFYNNLKYE